MQVFKCALRVMRAQIIFPLIYIVGLSFMGVFMAQSFDFENAEETFSPERGAYAVIDRDGSELSAGITTHLAAQGDEVAVADSPRAFQDAVAKGTVNYLLIVPEGFGEDFVRAARAGEELPQMETVFSYYSMEGAYLDEGVNSYLSCARTLALTDPSATLAHIAEESLAVASAKAEAFILPSANARSAADRFAFYLQWSTYTSFAGITVCIGMLTSTLGRSDVRRRNLASPLRFASYNLQLALACALATLFAWGWVFGLGLIAFPEAVAQMSTAALGWCAISLAGFCLIPLGLGYLLGQLGANGFIANAVGNICGLVASFFGGAWISLDLMTPEVLALAHCLPGYWYCTACQQAAHLSAAPSLDALAPVLQCIGVMLLFALALFCVALVVGKMRTRTSESGGNQAAVVPL